MFIYNGIMLYVQNLAVNIMPLQFIIYYVYPYSIDMFKKLMKSFQHELFISKSCPHGNVLFTMHSCILLNLHIMPPLPKKFDCLVLQEVLQCSQEPQHEETMFLYMELVLYSYPTILCIYSKIDIYIYIYIYMYKQSSIVLG